MMEIEKNHLEQHWLGEILRSFGGTLTKNTIRGFDSGIHKTIFTAMEKIQEENSPVDLITVTARLSADGTLHDIGGAIYLTTLVNMDCHETANA